MRVLLSYLSALFVVCCAVGDSIPRYPNGCVYVEKQDEILSRYDPEHLSAPFVNCANLSLNSIDYTIFNDSIVSLGLSRNQLITFNASNIVRFSKLHFLDLGRNKISTVSAVNASMPTLGNIYFGSNLLQEIPTVLFKSYKQLSSLNLFNNNITTIKDSDFIGANSLMSLTLARNPIKQISEAAFSSIKQILSLDLSDCGLTTVPSYTKDMKEMFMLNLGHNSITSVDDNSFANNTGLRLLSLASNKIDIIHPKAFEGAVKLSFIALSDNKIETLPQGIFNNMADENAGMFVELYENPIRCNCELQWLSQWLDDLEVRSEFEFTCAQPARNRYKHFHSISASDLTCDPDDKDWSEANQTECKREPSPASDDSEESTLCPTNCECYHRNGTKYQSADSSSSPSKKRRWWSEEVYPFVDCMDAGLTKFPDNIRSDVKNLRLLGNKIESLSIKSLEKFPSLSILNLEGCGLKTIIASPHTVLSNLGILEIQNNQLQVLTEEHLSSLPSLKVLSINNNKLETIPNDIFTNTQKLSVLSIGPNPIKAFDGRCLNGLDLTVLSLRKMNLTVVPTISSPNLHYLELSDNALTSIPNNSFSGFPQILKIMLAHNKITRLDVNAFKGCTRLGTLGLAENTITTLPRGVFDDLSRDRLTIELWRNRFYCDCKIKWFKEWIEQLEADDPQTDVRFSCMKPWRIHAQTSDTLHPDDFVCQPEHSYPGSSDQDDTHGACYTGGQIALTIFLTMFLTILSAFLIRWLCRFRDRRNRYQRPDDTARLDLDM